MGNMKIKVSHHSKKGLGSRVFFSTIPLAEALGCFLLTGLLPEGCFLGPR